jgi:hypothetical protein
MAPVQHCDSINTQEVGIRNPTNEAPKMAIKSKLMIATFAVAFVVLGALAWFAQDKYSLRLPNGLAFSEFRGYENWQLVSVG